MDALGWFKITSPYGSLYSNNLFNFFCGRRPTCQVTTTSIYIYIYIYMCVCVCVCWRHVTQVTTWPHYYMTGIGFALRNVYHVSARDDLLVYTVVSMDLRHLTLLMNYTVAERLRSASTIGLLVVPISTLDNWCFCCRCSSVEQPSTTCDVMHHR